MTDSNARRFHDATAHTPESVRRSGHTLEWEIKPFPFKVYLDTPVIPLPREVEALPTPTLAVLDGSGASPAVRMTLGQLTTLLYYTAGVTKRKEYAGGGEILFRAAASTGALYQTEVYVVAGDVDGLERGVYHFSPGDFVLRRLRDGDTRGTLAAAAEDALARRACTLVLTAIYWRNTWKYQARGYRHLFWDSGTMLANALAAGDALGLAPRVITGFVDATVNDLLGLDVAHEAALELIALGPESPPAPAPPALAPLTHAVMPLSRDEVDYPVLREALMASTLPDPDSVRAWRRARAPVTDAPAGELTPLPPPDVAGGRGLGETIQRRGSTRRFAHTPLAAAELGAALWAASRPIPQDVPTGLVELYIVVNAVDGVPSGAYRYVRDAHALERLAAGDFRRQSAFLTLEQPLGGEASAVIYFLSPLDAVLAAFGDRGYRLVNLEAGIDGGRAYLAAYALGFGASGLTFYDGEVVRFFSPRASGEDAIFVVALGRSAPPEERVLLSTPTPSAPRRS